MQKYLSASSEDFMEEFPRFPPEANPLDPRFADPRLLARQLIPRRQAQGAAGIDLGERRNEGGRPRRHRHFDGAEVDRIILADGTINQQALVAELTRLHEQGIDISAQELIQQILQFGGGGGEIGALPGEEGMLTAGMNVDLEAPLMQLFLQTMMPWYNMQQR
jgi:hypothetical protein